MTACATNTVQLTGLSTLMAQHHTPSASAGTRGQPGSTPGSSGQAVIIVGSLVPRAFTVQMLGSYPGLSRVVGRKGWRAAFMLMQGGREQLRLEQGISGVARR
jgi:hypothetical protein